MENKKDLPRRALGKGLSSLIRPPSTPPPREEIEARDLPVTTLPHGALRPNPLQPRKTREPHHMEELTQSIKEHGIIQPIVVRLKDGYYEIVAGERRWRAAHKANLTHVPVVVQEVSDERLLEIALVENIQREDLNPIELAMAYKTLAETLRLNHDEIASRTGKDRSSVTNALRLLQLSPAVMTMVSTGALSPGHGRVLLRIEEPARQRDVAGRACDGKMTVRQLEDYIGVAQPKKSREPKPEAAPDPNVKAAISHLEQALGTKVRVVEKTQGKGRIEIDYYSVDDLNRIYELIAGDAELR
ncbi:MAG TPA: chromosome partitioning protein ParB [Solibacterales bacterium]|nr:chromosome partitioning protein ParB [Bryobacterales bacterium]